MSALPTQNLKLDGAIDWRQWIEASEAATLLGVTRRHMTRECEGRLVASGLAMKTTPPSGGNDRWYIARRHDATLLAGVHGQNQQMPDLAEYPLGKVQEAMEKRACVDALRSARQFRPGKVFDWIDLLISELAQKHPRLKLSRTTLYAWDATLCNPADFKKLIDSRGGNQKAKGDPRDWKHFIALYCDDRKPSLAECWRKTKLHADGEGRQWCSTKSCQRQLDKRIAPEQQQYYREPAKWRSQSQPTIMQDAERFAAGRCWVGDHTQLDFWVRFNGSIIRPWITAWQDWRTRRIVGWTMSESPNSDTILGALGSGLKDPVNMGGPNEVLIDNGKDYDCWFLHGQTKQQRQQRVLNAGYVDEGQFRGLFAFLQIEPHFSIAYNPNGKARMERWFGTVHGQFDKSFRTYCGNSPVDRPESLSETLENVGQIPTFDHARQRFAEFVIAYNASADHSIDDLVESSERLSPDQAMSRWCTTQRVMADENAIDLLCRHWYPPVSVTKHGFSIAPYGFPLHYGYSDPALMPYKSADRKKQRVLVSFDPNDLREVHVWSEKFKFICTLRENEMGGMAGELGREVCARLMAAKRNYKKALKVADAGRHFEYLSSAEIIQSGRLEAPRPTPNPQALQIVQTPVDDPSNHRQFARKVVGAESDAMPKQFTQRFVPSLDALVAMTPDLDTAHDANESSDPWDAWPGDFSHE